MLSFWDIKTKYTKQLKSQVSSRSDRRKGKVMPLEEFLMDHCCVGRAITDNDSKNNVGFNFICDFCQLPVTSAPLSRHQINYFSALIPQAHLVGCDKQLLSFMSEDMFREFQDAIASKNRRQTMPSNQFQILV